MAASQKTGGKNIPDIKLVKPVIYYFFPGSLCKKQFTFWMPGNVKEDPLSPSPP